MYPFLTFYDFGQFVKCCPVMLKHLIVAEEKKCTEDVCSSVNKFFENLTNKDCADYIHRGSIPSSRLQDLCTLSSLNDPTLPFRLFARYEERIERVHVTDLTNEELHFLVTHGSPLDHYFLIHSPFSGSQICQLDPYTGQASGIIHEDNDIAMACEKYLRKCGREFRSYEDAQARTRYAHAFDWILRRS